MSAEPQVLTHPQPTVLIVAAKWWPLSARLAMALIRSGCRVGAVCPPGHPLQFVSGMDLIRRYGGLRSLASLRRIIVEWRPDVLVPGDDGVVAQLHQLHRQEPTLRGLIERSLGSPDGYAIVASRFELLKTAQNLGIRVPRTHRIDGAQDLVSWHEDHRGFSVLKVDGESGGNGVRISSSLEESLWWWRELSRRPTAARAWKRLAIDRDPLATWMRSNHPQRGFTIQEFIAGRPANSMLVSRQGAVLSQVSVLVCRSDGPTGAATIIRHVSDRRMAQAGELLAAKLHLSGFFGLDFMIEADTGTPYLIELNPRCTQLGHLNFPAQGSLAAAFSADLKGESNPPLAPPIGNGPIALFPQAFRKDIAQSPLLDSSYHDVPWDEPEFIRELLRDPGPIRRWASRLYHLVRPVTRQVPAEFEDAHSSFGAVKHCAVS